MLFDNLETAKSHPAQLSGGNPFPSNLCFTPLEGLKTFCRGRIQCSPRDFGCGWGCGGALCPLAGWELAGPSQGAETPPSKPSRACTSSVLFGLLVHQNIWECFSLGRWSCRCGSREWKCAVKWVLHCQGMLNISHRVSRNGCR